MHDAARRGACPLFLVRTKEVAEAAREVAIGFHKTTHDLDQPRPTRGLFDIAVGAESPCPCYIGNEKRRGRHDHGQIPELFAGANPTEEVEATFRSQFHIEHHPGERRGLAEDPGKRGFCLGATRTGNNLNIESGLLDGIPRKQNVVVAIINDEH